MFITPTHTLVMNSSIGQNQIDQFHSEYNEIVSNNGGTFEEYLESKNLPSFFSNILQFIIGVDNSDDMAVEIATSLASIVVWIKCFIILIIIFSIIIIILKRLVKKLRQSKKIRIIDGVFGIMCAICLTIVVSYTIHAIILIAGTTHTFKDVGAFFENELKSSIGIYKIYYNNNFIYNLLLLLT